MADNYKFKRVLLKLSGEALAGPDCKGLDENLVAQIAIWRMKK